MGSSTAAPPSHGLGRGRIIRDRTTEMPVPIIGVRRCAVYKWKPGIWFPASSSSFSGVRGSSGIGPDPVSSCRSCMNCRCCFGGPLSSGLIVLIQILPVHNQSDTRMMECVGDWLPVQNIPRWWMRRQPDGRSLVINMNSVQNIHDATTKYEAILLFALRLGLF